MTIALVLSIVVVGVIGFAFVALVGWYLVELRKISLRREEREKAMTFVEMEKIKAEMERERVIFDRQMASEFKYEEDRAKDKRLVQCTDGEYRDENEASAFEENLWAGSLPTTHWGSATTRMREG